MSGWPGRDGRVQAAGREKIRWMEVVRSGMTEPGRGTRSFEWCWRRPDRGGQSGKGHPVGRDGSRNVRTAGKEKPGNGTPDGLDKDQDKLGPGWPDRVGTG